MRRTGMVWVTLCAVAIVIGGCSDSPSERPAPRGVGIGTGGAGADEKSDSEFVNDVASMNMAEIELSRMAFEKATRPDIKAFAQQLIKDHDMSGNNLRSIVSDQSWPAQLDDKHREIADTLAKKQGADFDRDYLKAVIEGHQNLAARLESRLDVQSVAEWKTAAAGRTQGHALPDPREEMGDVQPRPNKAAGELTMKINQWAADTYPIAHKHLDTARTLENATTKLSTN